jgi:hypothetical protein
VKDEKSHFDPQRSNLEGILIFMWWSLSIKIVLASLSRLTMNNSRFQTKKITNMFHSPQKDCITFKVADFIIVPINTTQPYKPVKNSPSQKTSPMNRLKQRGTALARITSSGSNTTFAGASSRASPIPLESGAEVGASR